MFLLFLSHLQSLEEYRSKVNSGIPNMFGIQECTINIVNLGSVLLEGLKMTEKESKHVALK